jgi:tRNA threonylcarbamoyladenosine modification (KEOPS) complex Cgi121 subunit
MHFSKEIINELALQRAIEEIRQPKDTVKINDSTKGDKQIICVEIGTKKFSGSGETKPLAIKSVTEKIRNHKPALIKRQFGKIIKSVRKGI